MSVKQPGEQKEDSNPAAAGTAAESPSTETLERPQTMQLLSQFLMEEQEKRAKLREEHNLNSTWKDLQNAYEAASSILPDMGDDEYDTFNEVNTGSGNMMNRLALAASRKQFMASPDKSALKDKKARKDRKKKKKDAKKEAQKQARMMMSRGGNRF